MIYDRANSSYSGIIVHIFLRWALHDVTYMSTDSYAAFCRKFGDHYTAAVGSRNWNEEALESMVSDLKQPWQTLVRHITSKEQERTALIQRSVTWAVNHFGKQFTRMCVIVRNPLV